MNGQVNIAFLSAIKDALGDIIVMVTQVDPDAVASALAMAEILEKTRSNSSYRVKVVYCGSIGHPQNRAIFNKFLLGETFLPAKDVTLGESDTVILVDSHEVDDHRIPTNIGAIKPAVVIDHHTRKASTSDSYSKEAFLWIDGSVGAASTLLVELADELSIELSPGAKLSLALGIYTDTNALIGVSERDYQAYSYVTKGIDPNSLNQLLLYDLPESHFVNLGKAITRREIKDAHLLTDLGIIGGDEGDDVASVADYLLRMTGVVMVIVWAIVDGKVRVSARSDDATLLLDDFLKQKFGKKQAGAKLTPDGRGVGGALMDLNLGPNVARNEKVSEAAVEFVRVKMRAVVFNGDVW